MDKDSNNFNLDKSIEILERTPKLLSVLLRNLSDSWVTTNEEGESWSPFDILGHFIHGDQTDWVERAKIILSSRDDKTFEPFDRFGQFQKSKGKTVNDLLDEFTNLRAEKINELLSMNITGNSLPLKGMHPELGEVNLQQLIATWVVHDLSHLAHIVRTMANQYKDEVGPWIEYLRILN
jgi:hypothetical protein